MAFDLTLTLKGTGHIGRHVWRWVIVPSDLARTFGTICAHDRYCVIHRAITYMQAWFKSTRGKATHPKRNCSGGLPTKISGGTITHLHTWRQVTIYLFFLLTLFNPQKWCSYTSSTHNELLIWVMSKTLQGPQNQLGWRKKMVKGETSPFY